MVYDSQCKVKFENNSAETSGGAIFQTHSSQTFRENTAVKFLGNTADYGGAVFSEQMSITINDSSITFIKNAAFNGGAVFCQQTSFTISGRSMITLNNNYAKAYGGGILVNSSCIITQDSSMVTLSGNSASFGGAIYIF